MNYYISHYGVPGQRWGVRRYQNRDGSYTNAGKRRRKEGGYSEDYQRAHSNKNPDEMSTDELRKVNDRLNQERLYKQNTQKTYTEGQRYVQGVLKGVASAAIGAAVTARVTKAINEGNRFIDKNDYSKVALAAIGVGLAAATAYAYHTPSNSQAGSSRQGSIRSTKRYENSNGTYTKRGMTKYSKAQTKYSNADSSYKSAKAAYKNNPTAQNKANYKTAKANRNQAKREMDDSYKQLKTDARADKGKELYKNGNTITGYQARTTAAIIGGVALGIGSQYVANKIANNGTVRGMTIGKAVSTVGPVASAAAAATIAASSQVHIRQMRAYYAH